MNRTDTRLIGAIAPVTDEEAARLVPPGTLADLAAQITGTPADLPDSSPARGSSGTRRSSGARHRRRRVLLAVPAAAVVAAGIVGGLLATSGPSLPAAASRALSFTVSHGYITVIVKNPYADPSWYNADFRAHHLDITLRMEPVSPSLIGTVPFTDESDPSHQPTITTIYARCAGATSGGDRCPIGIKVPYNYRGQYDVYFGRAARPGEKYISVNSSFAVGEALHGMRYIVGQPVSTVLREIAGRHLTAVLNDHATFGPPSKFPGAWHVTDALPYAPGQVMLFISRSSHGEPPARTPSPAPPGASPSSPPSSG